MSLSTECHEYHLTPRGLVERSFHGDAQGGRNEVPMPADCMLAANPRPQIDVSRELSLERSSNDQCPSVRIIPGHCSGLV